MELWLRLRIRDFQLRELLRFGDYRVAVLRCLFSQIRHADIRTWPIDCGRVTPSSVDTPALIVTVVRVETAGGTSCSFVRVRSCAAPAQWNHDNASGDRRTSFRRQRNTSTITTPLHSVGRYYRSLRTSRHVVVVSGGRRVIIGQVRASRVNVIVTTAVRDTTTKSGRRPYTYDNNNHGESFYGFPRFRVGVDGADVRCGRRFSAFSSASRTTRAGARKRVRCHETDYRARGPSVIVFSHGKYIAVGFRPFYAPCLHSACTRPRPSDRDAGGASFSAARRTRETLVERSTRVHALSRLSD